MTVIAIDGPAASGKSSVATRLARRLSFAHVNSGAMYRAVTWEILRQQIDPSHPESIEAAVHRMSVDSGFTEAGESFIRINSEMPDLELQTLEVNQNVSPVAAIPAVRSLVNTQLRTLAEKRPIVSEGRDIGSVVFPDTPYKFYLDASPEVRRQRRAAQGLHDSIEKRDKLDSSRANAPLKIASGAYVIDTSHLTLEGVVDKVAEILSKSGIRPA
ncbi:MAG: (d)CMP kinase [Verrucomicrobia bacterium]|nr:(d)CMP kinase [Verrucomicrobiota bacterium]